MSRKSINLESVSDFNARAKSNMKVLSSGQTQYACACKNERFVLLQDTQNIKAVCSGCGDSRIIAWNSNGSVLNLATFEWSKPTAVITMQPNK